MASSAALAAPGPAPDLTQFLHWRLLGPFRGGRVLAVAGAPDDPDRFYFGAVNGGVWLSDDAGRTWQPLFDAGGIGSIGAIAIAPSAPQTLYVGTGEADMRSDIAQGHGLFRSTDGGRNWVPIGLADTQQIGAILVDPRNPETLLVAALGHPYGPNDQRGVFRSTDGGAHWQRTLYRDADTGAIALAFGAGNPERVYAALWQTRRPPWNVYPPSNGPGSGLYRSVDGGRSWQEMAGHGLPARMGRVGLATSPAAAHQVYALISPYAPGEPGGLYVSADDGGSWQRVSADPRLTNRGWYFSGLTVNPRDAEDIFVCDTVVLESRDGGRHFAPVQGDPTGDDFHTLWIDPANPERRMLGVDQGAMVSVDGGRSWSSWYNQPTGQFYHVITDDRFPYRVYGAQQDSGAASVDSRGGQLRDGISLMQFHESAAGGESDTIAPDPDDPDTVFGGRVDRLDLRDGQMRSVDPNFAHPGLARGTWTLPLVFGPEHALYFGNQRIFRTIDGGEHWRVISPDLTRADPAVPASLDASTQADVTPDAPGSGPRRGVVYTIAPAPHRPGLIWAGTDDGLVWRSSDGGGHWMDVTPAGLSAWSKIAAIAPDPFDPAAAYLAVDRHRLDDRRPYLYRTRDGGAHWQVITSGLPTGSLPASVNVVVADPEAAGLVYAGTELGAFVSFDAGAHWQSLGAGLPPTSVRDITVHGADLVIATHGRGFYVLDDVTALRALARDPAPALPVLFPLAPAVRVRLPDFTGTPLPKDEPAAPEPPDGLVIDYALPAGVTHVLLRISDGAGREVRRFDSAEAAPGYDPGKADVPAAWVVSPPVPATGPGGHRLVWDLRRVLPGALEGLKADPPPKGRLALPGRYTVTLTADGVSRTAPALVLVDPRSRAGMAALRAAHDLAARIEAAEIAVAQAMGRARAIAQNGADPGRRAAARALLGPSAATDQTLAGLQARLLALAGGADTADAAPSPDAQAGFAGDQAMQRDLLARLAALRP